MTSQELLYTLQCCQPNNLRDRDCFSCPLSGCEDCHTALCEEVIAYILMEQGKSERFARGVDSVVDAVNNLHSLY